MKTILVLMFFTSILVFDANATVASLGEEEVIEGEGVQSVRVIDIEAFNFALEEMKAKYPGLEAYCEGTFKERDTYIENCNPDYLEENLKVHGLRNFFVGQLQRALAVNDWISENGYKYFPNEGGGEESLKVCAFSAHFKPMVTEITKLTQVPVNLVEQMYCESRKATEYLPYIHKTQLALKVIDRIEGVIKSLPSIDDWQPSSLDDNEDETGEPRETPEISLEAYINSEVFELCVLNEALGISMRPEHPLNVMVADQRVAAIDAIISQVNIGDLEGTPREQSIYKARVATIIADNFGM